MSEPTSSVSLTVIAIGLLGPLAGPYALIVFASLAGAMWPLNGSKTENNKEGAWLLARCTLTAVLLTVFIAELIEKYFDIPANNALGVVALIIGAMGNGWRRVFGSIASGLGAIISKAGGQNGA